MESLRLHHERAEKGVGSSDCRGVQARPPSWHRAFFSLPHAYLNHNETSNE